MPPKAAPKKRGRKPKKKTDVVKPPPKKRGRKPKGGKIIKKNEKIKTAEQEAPPNIILQLKCKSSDLKSTINFTNDYNPNIANPEAYNIQNNTKMLDLQYEEIKHETVTPQTNVKFENNFITSGFKEKKEPSSEKINIRQIWEKLNILKRKLRCNDVSDKRSACFWCTYEFDNPAIYIPKRYNNNLLEVYGCFCSPECALAHLKNEEIDNSTKWERYALLNNVYSKIYNYTKNIKPAPNPHYALDKFYGNLTIHEYRKLLQNDRILMVVDKPMTKVLPELYEENNEMPNVYNNMLITNQSSNKTDNFRLKRSQTKQTKSNALTNTFNL